ncbi:MAG: IS110 family transposase [Frankiaceae bacterium]
MPARGSWAPPWTGPRRGPRRRGSPGVTVGCEPTGHRWQVVGQLAAERGMPFVCVQTLLVAWARRNEDLTNDKTDDRDAMLIGRLVSELRCYQPEAAEQTWTRLRHLGPAGNAWSRRRSGRSSRCVTRWSARGRRCSRPPRSRSSPPPGVRPWTSS